METASEAEDVSRETTLSDLMDAAKQGTPQAGKSTGKKRKRVQKSGENLTLAESFEAPKETPSIQETSTSASSHPRLAESQQDKEDCSVENDSKNLESSENNVTKNQTGSEDNLSNNLLNMSFSGDSSEDNEGGDEEELGKESDDESVELSDGDSTASGESKTSKADEVIDLEQQDMMKSALQGMKAPLGEYLLSW